jgi:hypothetical protein
MGNCHCIGCQVRREEEAERKADSRRFMEVLLDHKLEDELDNLRTDAGDEDWDDGQT